MRAEHGGARDANQRGDEFIEVFHVVDSRLIYVLRCYGVRLNDNMSVVYDNIVTECKTSHWASHRLALNLVKVLFSARL